MAKIFMNSLPPELTPEEIAELEGAENMPIIYEEDCPEMTTEMLQQFHRMQRSYSMILIQFKNVSKQKIKRLPFPTVSFLIITFFN